MAVKLEDLHFSRSPAAWSISRSSAAAGHRDGGEEDGGRQAEKFAARDRQRAGAADESHGRRLAGGVRGDRMIAQVY